MITNAYLKEAKTAANLHVKPAGIHVPFFRELMKGFPIPFFIVLAVVKLKVHHSAKNKNKKYNSNAILQTKKSYIK